MVCKQWGFHLQDGMQWDVVESLHNVVQCCAIVWNVL